MYRQTDHSSNMDDPVPDLLDGLERRAQALVAQRLRSVTAVLARLLEPIGQAHAFGHSHADIHARLRAAGLAVSWNNYRAGLVRVRRRAGSAAVAATSHTPHTPCAPRTKPETAVMAAPAPHGGEPGAMNSPVQLLEALANAQRTAARDYTQAARTGAGPRRPRSPP